jgi:hypothetical protein
MLTPLAAKNSCTFNEAGFSNYCYTDEQCDQAFNGLQAGRS